jgi:uncharacterized protein
VPIATLADKSRRSLRKGLSRKRVPYAAPLQGAYDISQPFHFIDSGQNFETFILNHWTHMKIAGIILFTVLAHFCIAQTKPARIVFDITSKDTLAHQTVIRHIKGLSEAYPDAQLEVVIYGGALPMMMTEKSTQATKIKELSSNKNISFKVCEGTMKRYSVTKSQLLPGVGTVPDAIMEIVQKQGEGWGYIKEVAN